ncbi:hypothetical protein GCM10009716_36970 [Streptomyces sodiiphilus]|uniref:Uncharacterized protein n=1 Tax=Streptomyces sodiiphilus TaxID=226217 RepID=A0ABP5AYV4_9ACTN
MRAVQGRADGIRQPTMAGRLMDERVAGQGLGPDKERSPCRWWYFLARSLRLAEPGYAFSGEFGGLGLLLDGPEREQRAEPRTWRASEGRLALAPAPASVRPNREPEAAGGRRKTEAPFRAEWPVRHSGSRQ